MSTFDVSVGAPVRETAVASADAPASAAPAPGPGAAGAADEVPPEVSEPVVRSILQGLGFVLSTVDRVPGTVELWRWKPEELDQVVPPLTRAANRSPALRKALVHGDIVAISLALGTYGARNISARKEALNAISEGKVLDVHGQLAGGIAGGQPGAVGAPLGANSGHGGPVYQSRPGALQ
jgi:hypothetical protein